MRTVESLADVRTVVEKVEETSVDVRAAVEKSAVGLGGGGVGDGGG